MNFSGAEAKETRRLLIMFQDNIERTVNYFFDNVAMTSSTSAKAPISASIDSFGLQRAMGITRFVSVYLNPTMTSKWPYHVFLMLMI